MKKTQKRVLGFSGLALVTAMTAYAVTLPSPNVSAVDNTSVTETLVVRVVGIQPDVKPIFPVDRVTSVFSPLQEIEFEHENVEDITVSIKHTKLGDTESGSEVIIKESFVDFITGKMTIPLNLDEYGGFGTFTLSIVGTGYGDAVPDREDFEIKYMPFDATKTELRDDSSFDVNLEYDENVVEYLKINVYAPSDTGRENPVWSNDNKKIEFPVKTVEIPFGELAREEGNYIIEVTGYDRNDVLLYTIDLEQKSTYVYVPNTGAMLKKLNIAKEDYIITGVLIFFVLSVVALGAVIRGRKERKTRK